MIGKATTLDGRNVIIVSDTAPEPFRFVALVERGDGTVFPALYDTRGREQSTTYVDNYYRPGAALPKVWLRKRGKKRNRVARDPKTGRFVKLGDEG